MAKKMCKCAVCNESFDRNSIQAVKFNARRYAHQTCYPEGEVVEMEEPIINDPDLQDLKDYLKKIFGNRANWPSIMNEIKRYIKQGYSCSGIKKTLFWWFEIQKQSPARCNGHIAIVPHIYEQAKDYYHKVYLIQKSQQNIVSFEDYKKNKKEVKIASPRINQSKKMMLFWEDEDE